jgi:hypothetical protein
MNLSRDDWQTLTRLRTAFLEGSAGRADYWQSERDLANYDQTFAQRIGWKWDFVLDELKRRVWQPPAGAVFDWGCGSGIAHRAYLDHFGVESASRLLLWDRSALAVHFAMRRASEKYPGLPLGRASGPDELADVLLVSHVLTELNHLQVDELIARAKMAKTVLWVEPGTHAASRALIDVREQLRDTFQVVAPCTHQAVCGMVTPENAEHWCHHFAQPPPEVFTDGDWARFAALAEIDLRSLPLSFLVLDRRPVPPWPPGTVRIIGRPRVYKSHLLLLGSGAEGLRERRLTKRALPVEYRQLKKGDIDPVQVWECEGDEITRLKPAHA